MCSWAVVVCAYSYADPNSNPNSNPNPDSDSYTNANANANPDSYTNANPDANPWRRDLSGGTGCGLGRHQWRHHRRCGGSHHGDLQGQLGFATDGGDQGAGRQSEDHQTVRHH